MASVYQFPGIRLYKFSLNIALPIIRPDLAGGLRRLSFTQQYPPPQMKIISWMRYLKVHEGVNYGYSPVLNDGEESDREKFQERNRKEKLFASVQDSLLSGNEMWKKVLPSHKILTLIGSLFLMSALAITFGIIIFDNTSGVDSDDGDTGVSTYVDTSQRDFDFTLLRSGYDPLPYFSEESSGVIKYNFLSSYTAIIEPYAPMELELMDTSNLMKGLTYYYTICEVDSLNSTIASNCVSSKKAKTVSETIKIECTPHSFYYITVNELKRGSISATSNHYAICMYVRREIRTLSDDDLAATMDAMYEIWANTESEGQAKYGESFHGAGYFAEAHTFNAAQQDSDHIHEGQGFLAQHVKITNIYELAIQSVDSSVTLFYWDYTVDIETGLQLSESPMFNEGTFGDITYPADSSWGWTYSNDSMEDAAIPNGRWVKQKTDVNNKYPDLGNSFGYMRGPWNYNPSPYISRFSIAVTRLPACSAYYAWLEGTVLEDFNADAPFAPHASTHGAIGAVFGCDMFISLLRRGAIKDQDSLMAICKKWGFYLKEFYRSGVMTRRDEEDCTIDSLDYDGVDCGVICPDTGSDKYDTLKEAMKKQITVANVPDNFDDWDVWVDFLCTGDGYKVFVGDHLESASPSDPSFWPIHPNQERLLQLKLMTGGFEDNEWPTDAANVCDKSKCYVSDLDDKDYYEQCCYGHYIDDQLLDFVSGDRYSGYGLTNRQVYEFTDPRSDDYNMFYIYDDFSWSHCEDEDFASLTEELYEKYF